MFVFTINTPSLGMFRIQFFSSLLCTSSTLRPSNLSVLHTSFLLHLNYNTNYNCNELPVDGRNNCISMQLFVLLVLSTYAHPAVSKSMKSGLAELKRAETLQESPLCRSAEKFHELLWYDLTFYLWCVSLSRPHGDRR